MTKEEKQKILNWLEILFNIGNDKDNDDNEIGSEGENPSEPSTK